MQFKSNKEVSIHCSICQKNFEKDDEKMTCGCCGQKKAHNLCLPDQGGLDPTQRWWCQTCKTQTDLDRSPAGFVEDNENGVRPFNVDDWEVAETGRGYNFK